MKYISANEYDIYVLNDQTHHIIIDDHLGGFDQSLRSPVLDRIHNQTQDRKIVVETEYIVNQQIKKNYPNFDLRFSLDLHNRYLKHFFGYNIHPELTFENFLCSFNGSHHTSRILLMSILKKVGWFDPMYSTKNVVFSAEQVDGHLQYYLGQGSQFYGVFFNVDDEFRKKTFSIDYKRTDHVHNIYALERSLTGSFVHLVSETMGTSYYPFYGEKFLYSIVTRGLFVCYGQPLWHDTLERCYGFKKYTKLFDYRFDMITNPVERLLELISMLGKFSNLNSKDWHDLYLLESDNIEYNYNHYYSQDYKKSLERFT